MYNALPIQFHISMSIVVVISHKQKRHQFSYHYAYYN